MEKENYVYYSTNHLNNISIKDLKTPELMLNRFDRKITHKR